MKNNIQPNINDYKLNFTLDTNLENTMNTCSSVDTDVDNNPEQPTNPKKIVDLAVLYNNLENETNSHKHMNMNSFTNICTSICNIDYATFKQISFDNKTELFDILILDHIYKTLQISILQQFWNIHKKKSKCKSSESELKIKLTKEFSFSEISEIITRVESLNINEFENEIRSLYAADSELYARLTLFVYSKTLKRGIKIPFLFKIQDIPSSVLDNINVCDEQHTEHEYNIVL
jgi:hypothetical protein